MATKYWVGNAGVIIDSTKWSNSSGVSFRANRTTNLVTYSSLVGTISNGQTIFGASLDSNGFSKSLGVVTNLNTTTKTFNLYIGGVLQTGVNTNEAMCGGVTGTTAPVSTDSLIFNGQSGTLGLYFTFPGANATAINTYLNIDFTGYTGTMYYPINITGALVLPTSANYDISCYLCLTGSVTSAGTIAGSVPLAIGTVASYVGPMTPGTFVYTYSNGTVNINSNITMTDAYSVIFVESGTVNTNNYTLNLQNLYIGPVLGTTLTGSTIVFNAGTSSITTGYFSTQSQVSYTYSLTINGTSTIVCTNTLDNQNNNSLYSLVLQGAVVITSSTNTSANFFTLDNATLTTDSTGYATLTKLGGGTVTSTKTSFTNIHVSPSQTFYANNSTNVSGNLGITFSTNSFMVFF